MVYQISINSNVWLIAIQSNNNKTLKLHITGTLWGESIGFPHKWLIIQKAFSCHDAIMPRTPPYETIRELESSLASQTSIFLYLHLKYHITSNAKRQMLIWSLPAKPNANQIGLWAAVAGIELITHLVMDTNGRHFAHDIFKRIFLNEKVQFFTFFVLGGPIDDKPALV